MATLPLTGDDLDNEMLHYYGATRLVGETDDQFKNRVAATRYGPGSRIQFTQPPWVSSPPTITPVTVSPSGTSITLHFNGPLVAFAPTDPVRITAGIYKGCRGVIRQDTGQPGEWFVDLPGIGITRLLETEMMPDGAAAIDGTFGPTHQPSLPSTPPPPPGTRDRKWPICESTRCWSAALIAKEWLETGGIQESEELLRDAVRRAVSREPKRY